MSQTAEKQKDQNTHPKKSADDVEIWILYLLDKLNLFNFKDNDTRRSQNNDKKKVKFLQSTEYLKSF